MATTKVRTNGKSGFLKEFFVDHVNAKKTAIDKAWRKAGNADSISTSLLQKVRAELGLARKRRNKSTGKRITVVSQVESNSVGRTAVTNGKAATAIVERSAKTRVVGTDSNGE